MSTLPDPGDNPEHRKRSGGLFRRGLRQWVMILAGLAMVASISVVAVDATDHVFSTQQFCAYTCHVMTSTVYEELKETKHWSTPTGVRAKCADCHVSRSLTLATLDHIYGTKELFVWLMNDFSEPGSFEEFRPGAADRIRMKMLKKDSSNCKTCHDMEGIKPERVRGQNAHNDALANGNSNCIACHYNLVHKSVEPSDDFLEAAEKFIGEPAGEGEASGDEGYSDDLEML